MRVGKDGLIEPNVSGIIERPVRLDVRPDYSDQERGLLLTRDQALQLAAEILCATSRGDSRGHTFGLAQATAAVANLYVRLQGVGS